MPILGVIASSAKGAPGIPTIGTATNVGTGRAYNNGAATVTFTAGAGATATSFTATSSPGGFTATGASSPLTVEGLQSAISYTFTVTATNAAGTSAASSASNSITATTVPQAPTIGTPTCATGQAYTGSANISVAFTAGATGGAAISSFTATSSSSATGSGASSPVTVSQTVGSSYTYTVTATNANGTSTASGTSASVLAASVPQAPTIGTATRTGDTTVSQAYTSNATGGSAITSVTATSSPSISLSTSGTSSPVTITGTFVQGTGYTFTLTQTNAYGTSSASASSNSVTPFPTPVLSAWTSSTSTPAGNVRILTSIGGLMTNPNNILFWAGTGYNSVSNGTNLAYGFETTSTWGTYGYAYSAFGPGTGRISGSTALGVGGQPTSAGSTSNRGNYNGITWGAPSPAYPISVQGWTGIAAMSGGIRYAAGQNENRSYSQPDQNSAFTLQTAYPLSGTVQMAAVDNGTFNGNMYTFHQFNSVMYYATSLTSGWTAGATNPNTGGNIPNATTDNNNIIVAFRNSPNTMYAFNKSNNTFTTIGNAPTSGFFTTAYSKDGLLRSVQKDTVNVAGTHHYASYA